MWHQLVDEDVDERGWSRERSTEGGSRVDRQRIVVVIRQVCIERYGDLREQAVDLLSYLLPHLLIHRLVSGVHIRIQSHHHVAMSLIHLFDPVRLSITFRVLRSLLLNDQSDSTYAPHTFASSTSARFRSIV